MLRFRKVGTIDARLMLANKKAAKMIKETMDKKFGPSWFCIISDSMCFDIDY